MFCFQIVTKQIDEFLLTELFSIRSADWILYPSYKHVNVTISPHIHVKQTTAVLINTLFCVFFLSSTIPPPSPPFFFFAPSAYSVFFFQSKTVDFNVEPYALYVSVYFAFKRRKKEQREEKRGIKCEHAYTVWKKKKKIIFYIHALIFLSLSSYVSRPQVNICP